MYFQPNRFLLIALCYLLLLPVISQYFTIRDNNLRIYSISGLSPDFTSHRPHRADSSIILCVPAAFTSTKIGHVDGIYVIDGQNHFNDTMHRIYDYFGLK